jgi:diacylglycerol kinase family enzyme
MSIFVLINKARRAKPPDPEVIDGIRGVLQRNGLEHVITLTESADEAKTALETARNAGVDALWIAGGDGSIHHLVAASYKWGIPYGIIPMGTVNALARSFDIPPDPIEAAEYLVKATPTPMDIGEVNGKAFVVFASVGYHADVVHGVSNDLKRRLGKFAFLASGLKSATGMRRLPIFSIEFQDPGIDNPGNAGKTIKLNGQSVVISNICNYAGFGIVRDEACAPGFMKLHLFHRNHLRPMLGWFFRMRMTEEWDTSVQGVEHYTISECLVKSKHSLRLQLDGEPAETANSKELTFRCIPKAIKLLLK